MVSTEHIWMELGNIRETLWQHGSSLERINYQNTEIIKILDRQAQEIKTYSRGKRSTELSPSFWLKVVQWVSIGIVGLYGLKSGVDISKIFSM